MEHHLAILLLHSMLQIVYILPLLFCNSYVITRLHPYTPYEFIVVPFRRGFSGEPSALFVAWTLEARPAQAPTDLKWYQVNTSSIDVTWKPFAATVFRGKPLGYQVSTKIVLIYFYKNWFLYVFDSLKYFTWWGQYNNSNYVTTCRMDVNIPFNLHVF